MVTLDQVREIARSVRLREATPHDDGSPMVLVRTDAVSRAELEHDA